MVNKSCDIVVLGGGGSGLVAAVKAAQAGKKVVVLEKNASAGGGMRGAKAMRTFGSQWQKDHNIPDKTAEYLRKVMDECYWRLDTRLVTNAIRATGEFFDWACSLEPIADKFVEGTYVFDSHEDQHGPTVPAGNFGTGAGKVFMDEMKRQCDVFGVDLMLNTPVKDVELTDGKISAVIAECEGENYHISCRVCILAIGSWVSNRAVAAKICPQLLSGIAGMGGPGGAPGGPGGPGGPEGMPPMDAPGGPGGPGDPSGDSEPGEGANHTSSMCSGDGIPIAEKAGAYLDYSSFCFRPMGAMYNCGSESLSTTGTLPHIIEVNKLGKRFCAEGVMRRLGFFDAGHVHYDQPDAEIYAIMDMNVVRHAMADANAGLCDEKNNSCIYDLPRFAETWEEVEADIRKAMAGPMAVTHADTIGELAAKIGIDPAQLEQTVAEYNHYCQEGTDWQCYKDPKYLVPLKEGPFFAIRGMCGTDGAFGGVLVDPDMRAYKANKSGVIDNLFVTGDFASGRFVVMGGVKHQVLNDMSWALASGYLAGKNAAEMLK